MRYLALMLVSLTYQIAEAAPDSYSISTLKNGQQIGLRKVSSVEMRQSSSALANAFQEKRPSYDEMLDVAASMTAKDRCFNLFSAKLAVGAVEAGKIDVSATAESFLKDTIATIDQINKQTNVSCEIK